MAGFIEKKAKKIAVSAILGVLAGISLVIGLAFLTAAGWIALADRYDTLVAALVIGCVYVAISAVLWAILSSHSRRPVPMPAAPPPPSPAKDPLALVEAFFSGFEAARRRGKGK